MPTLNAASVPRFSTVILKLTSFCNLNCSYCYMFNLGDRTFERMPRYMPVETAITAVDRLATQARSRQATRMNVVLHGGEPTLWPIDNFVQLLEEIRAIRSTGIAVEVSLQTNGLHLDRNLVALFMQHDVMLGFSLDGPARYNDEFRVTHSGSGSYKKVVDTINRVLDWGYNLRRLGALCVINPKIDPTEFLDWACGGPMRNINVLWPIEFSWSRPPWQAGDEKAYAANPAYGRWMASAFEKWWNEYVDQLFVLVFYDTIARMMGSHTHTDSIGNDCIDMFVVNCGGNIEYPDYLRAQLDGGAASGRLIHNTSLDELSGDRVFDTLLNLRKNLPAICKECRHADVCGGGFIAGRSDATGFRADRRSVLCYDHLFYYDAVHRIVAPYIMAMNSSQNDPEESLSLQARA